MVTPPSLVTSKDILSVLTPIKAKYFSTPFTRVDHAIVTDSALLPAGEASLARLIPYFAKFACVCGFHLRAAVYFSVKGPV